MRIPADVDWITKKERAYIETGFALYPVSLACGQDDQFSRERRFMRAMGRFVQLQCCGKQYRCTEPVLMYRVTRLYPEETEAALFRAVSSVAVAAQTPCPAGGMGE